jgi:hypothetical protein
MLAASANTPQPGQLVHVRQRRYLVEDVTPPPAAGEATVVSWPGWKPPSPRPIRRPRIGRRWPKNWKPPASGNRR